MLEPISILAAIAFWCLAVGMYGPWPTEEDDE